jgi:hypothetical protein
MSETEPRENHLSPRQPPPVPAASSSKNRVRYAHVLNLVVPGAGQYYLGQKLLGCVFAAPFLVCLLAFLAISTRGFTTYLDALTSGSIPRDRILGYLFGVFHVGWLFALLLISIALYLLSAVSLWLSTRARPEAVPPGR